MLHLIKLCVGVDSLEELAGWQKKRLAEKKKKGQKPELIHVTRQTPKRAAELLDGGSLYWVIKGQIAARQRLIAAFDIDSPEPDWALGYVWDIVLRGRSATVFETEEDE